MWCLVVYRQHQFATFFGDLISPGLGLFRSAEKWQISSREGEMRSHSISIYDIVYIEFRPKGAVRDAKARLTFLFDHQFPRKFTNMLKIFQKKYFYGNFGARDISGVIFQTP